MTTKEIGDIGENAAALFLKKDGYRIVARNVHMSHNEIDIIAEDKEFIVFVEVKTRTDTDNRFGVPSSAVTYSKQRRLIAAAIDYMREKKIKKQPRMDVIEVWLDKSNQVLNINHIRNAYGA